MKTKKWTFIDTLIVLIVVIAAAVGVVMLKPSLGQSVTKDKVEFTVLIANREKELAEAITPDVRATLSLTEKDGGMIKDVALETAKQMTFNSIDGTYSIIEIEDKYDIYVTIEADCDITDKYIKTGDTDIKVGASIPVRGRGFATNGFVIDIKEAE